MLGDRDRDLASEFFEKAEPEATGFEITLAALIASALLTYPISGAKWISYLISFILLLVTLIRRVSVASPFANREAIVAWSTPLIEIFTTLALITLFVPLSDAIGRWLGLASFVVFPIIALSFVSCICLMHEFLFRDYLIWWHVKFGQKAEEGDPPQVLWRDISMISYYFSLARRSRNAWRKIPSRRKPDLENFDYEFREWLKIFTLCLIVLCLLMVVPAGAGFLAFGFWGVLFAPAVIFLHDHACFWYIAYGSSSYEDFRRPWWTIILFSTMYVAFVIFLMDSFTLSTFQL